MAELLVSVKSEEEARLAVAGGADIIDIKDPAYGSLGAPAPATVENIISAVPGRPISVAAGDLPSWPGTIALAVRGALTILGVRWVKVGLTGSYRSQDLAPVWAQLANEAVSRIIPVFYLDRATPEALAQAARGAADIGMTGVVFDTFDKRHAFDHWMDVKQLYALVKGLHAHGLWVGLAGHISRDNLSLALDTEADVVGVRSAVCRHGERTGALDRALVQDVKTMVKSRRVSQAGGPVWLS